MRHTNDREPGIRRMGKVRFRFVDETTGASVTDPEVLARIDALVIPPAWTDVWVCSDPHGHLQATGRDARGRKQYRYHTRFRSGREAAKFADLAPFGEALGPLRQRLRTELDGREWDFDHVVALVISLLDSTHIRVGNEQYAQSNKTFGLTTLRNRHLATGGGTRLRFVGKSGKEHDVPIADRRLAAQVRRCRELPGQHLFQWIDVTGNRHPVTSGDVNERLRELTGIEVTAKAFRTWGASVRAAVDLATVESPSTEREADRAVVEAVDAVAARLGNTRAVARASYVHPVVVDAFRSGQLAQLWSAAPSRPAGGLTADERRLLHVLREARPPARKAA